MHLSSRAARRLSVSLTAAAVLTLGLVLYSPVFGEFSRVLIMQPIDESKLVTLAGNTRPEATAENDRGAVPDSFPMKDLLLQLKRSPVLESEFAQYIDQLTDKSSPNFRKWLTPQQIGDRYGLAREDLAAIQNWLQSHGFSVDHTYENGMVIAFSGTAGQIRDAFHTQIDYLQSKNALFFFEKHFDMGFSRVFGYVPQCLLRDSIKRGCDVGRNGFRNIDAVVGRRHFFSFSKLFDQRLKRRWKSQVIQNRRMKAM